MSKQEVFERAHIKFPRAINLEKLEDLLSRIANNLSCDIPYEIKTNKIIYKRYRENLEDELLHIEVSGSINSEEAISESFMCGNPNGNYIFFNSLNFRSIPGNKSKQYRKETKDLWDKVREQVRFYFYQKRSKK